MSSEILKRDQNHVTVLGGITDDADQDVEMLRVDPISKRLLIKASFSGAGVSSLNGLTGDVILAAGSNVTITPTGNTLTIASSGGGSGSPGGLNTQIQYNNSGSFGGITGATTDGSIVSLSGAHLLNPTINGAGVGLATLVYPNTASNATITVPATTGTLALTSQLTVFIDNEVVSGSGTTFTLANTPIVGSEHVFGQGQRLYPTTDYTISGAVITTVQSWNTGMILSDYRK